jgi:hypothetical protein
MTTRIPTLLCRRILLSPLMVMGTLVACDGGGSAYSGPQPTLSPGHDMEAVEGVGFETPSSVLHDEVRDLYLVSNINGAPLERDGNGFISRMYPDGRMHQLHWIEGGKDGAELHAPKGLAISGDTLYVADIDCVRLFNRISGDPLGSVCPEGASNLHDLVVQRRGPLYVTDRTGILFAIEGDGSYSVRLQGEDLGEPTGIATSARGVFVAGFQNGSVSQLWPEELKPFVRGRDWKLDGLAITEDGSFAFTNWADSTILLIQASRGGSRGNIYSLVQGIPTPGDLGYDGKRNRLLVPVLEQNRVFFVDLWS